MYQGKCLVAAIKARTNDVTYSVMSVEKYVVKISPCLTFYLWHVFSMYTAFYVFLEGGEM